MRKITICLIVVVFTFTLFSSCSKNNFEDIEVQEELCSFMFSVIGKDVDTAERMVEKKYGLELTRIGPEYKNGNVINKPNYDRYNYDARYTEHDVTFSRLYLEYSHLKKSREDGILYSIGYHVGDMSLKEAENCYQMFSDYFYDQLGITPFTNKDGYDSDDYCISNNFVKDGYTYHIDYYYSGNKDRASFTVYCLSYAEEYYVF